MKREQNGYRYILDIQDKSENAPMMATLLFKHSQGAVGVHRFKGIEVDTLLKAGELSIPTFAYEKVSMDTLCLQYSKAPNWDTRDKINAVMKMHAWLSSSPKSGVPGGMVFRPTFVRDLVQDDWIRLEFLKTLETDKGQRVDFRRITGQVTDKGGEWDATNNLDMTLLSVDSSEPYRLTSRHHVEVFTLDIDI